MISRQSQIALNHAVLKTDPLPADDNIALMRKIIKPVAVSADGQDPATLKGVQPVAPPGHLKRGEGRI